MMEKFYKLQDLNEYIGDIFDDIITLKSWKEEDVRWKRIWKGGKLMWSAILITSVMVGSLGVGYIVGVLSRRKGSDEEKKELR